MNNPSAGLKTWLLLTLLLVGCSRSASDQTSSILDVDPEIEMRLAHTEPVPGSERFRIDQQVLYLEPPFISDEDFLSVDPEPRPNGLLLDYRLRPEAGARLRRVTRENIGEQMAIVVQSIVRVAPTIVSEIGSSGQAMLPMSEEAAESLAELIGRRWP